MRILAKIHIWLGWLIAIPLLVWTISGLVMVAKPAEEIKGERYRLNADARTLPPGWLAAQLIEGDDRPVEMRTRMQGNSVVTSAIYSDGKIERYFARSGEPVPEIDLAAARTIVAMEIAGGDQVTSVRFFEAASPPADFDRNIPVWQVVLSDGTHVYVGRESGDIEAIRTPAWRTVDMARSLHIMDLQVSGDAHNALIATLAGITLLMSVLGTVLLFRRKKPQSGPKPLPLTATAGE